jgi:tyrosine-protein kinase Fer
MESRPFNDLFVQGMTNTKAREMLDSGYRMPAPEGTSDDMYNLMLRCWNYEAEARPHFKEIHSKIDILFSRYLRFFMNYLKTLGRMK